MFYSDSPERDFDRYDMEQERRRARLPVCEDRKCGKRIQDEECFEIDGEILCRNCMERRYMRYTEDFIEI